MPRCLVTGAAGFIGSHLSEELVHQGFEVTGVDALRDYYPRRIKLSNIHGISSNPRFKFLELDLAVADLREIVKESDFIFHLAAQPGVRASWGKTFSSYVTDNIIATQRLLEAAKDSNVKQIVYASSSSIYGDSEQLPTPEDATPRPNSPYGATKLAGESLCRVYGKNFGVPVVILRYFSVYGPRQRPDMAFNRFIGRISRGLKIEVLGSGNQARDFTYVSDIVSGTVGACDAPVGSVLNVGAGKSVKLRDAIRIIERHIGKKAHIVYRASAAGDVKKTSADISRIRRSPHYAPQVDLDEGLRRQIRWQVGES